LTIWIGGSKVSMCVYRSLFAIDSVKEHQVGFNL